MKNADEILRSREKFHIKLGLERIEKILDLLGNPQNNYKIIHIAGTNGKGSTSKIINDILINANIKTGLFTSPHLFCYEERLKVDNENISKYVFKKLINDIDSLALENNVELSEFELITAAAFYYFYVKGVDYVVLETGLGGAFDATNIVKNSLLEVITTIDFDHKERLGDTIEKIASQKAGIIKENSKVIVLKDNKGFEVIKKTAEEKNAQLICADLIKFEKNDEKTFAIFNEEKLEFNLLGSFQAQNLSLALCAIKNLDIEIPLEAVKKGLKNVSWDFRAQYIKEKKLLIDSAHNPSGTKALKQVLDENFKQDKKTFIFSCLKNKDYQGMLDNLIEKEDELYFLEFDYPNALKFEELDKKYGAKKIDNLGEVLDKENLKIIFGSIYMLGNVFKNSQFDKSSKGI